MRKSYTVTVTAEISLQIEVDAGNRKSAANLALKKARESVEIVFDQCCISPDEDWRCPQDDQVELTDEIVG